MNKVWILPFMSFVFVLSPLVLADEDGIDFASTVKASAKYPFGRPAKPNPLTDTLSLDFTVTDGHYLRPKVPASGSPCGINLKKVTGMEAVYVVVGAVNSPVSVMTCPQKEPNMTEIFTPLFCRQREACADNILLGTTLPHGVQSFINETIVEDFVTNEIERNIHGTEKFELLSQYMKKKHPQRGVFSCSDKFKDNSKDGKCNSRINNVFKKIQSKCSFHENFCFSSVREKENSFETFLQESDFSLTANYFTDYFQKRTKDKMKSIEGAAESSFKELARILETPGTAEHVRKRFLEKVTQLQSEGKLDPIFSFYGDIGINTNTQNDKIKERFAPFLDQFLKDRSKNALEELTKFQGLLGDNLVDANCDAYMSYNKMCLETEKILMGKRVETSLKQTQKRRDEDLKSKIDTLAQFLPEKEGDRFDSKKKAQILLDSARCLSFEMFLENKSIVRMSEKFAAKFDNMYNGRLSDIKKPVSFIDPEEDVKTTLASIRSSVVSYGDSWRSTNIERPSKNDITPSSDEKRNFVAELPKPFQELKADPADLPRANGSAYTPRQEFVQTPVTPPVAPTQPFNQAQFVEPRPTVETPEKKVEQPVVSTVSKKTEKDISPAMEKAKKETTVAKEDNSHLTDLQAEIAQLREQIAKAPKTRTVAAETAKVERAPASEVQDFRESQNQGDSGDAPTISSGESKSSSNNSSSSSSMAQISPNSQSSNSSNSSDQPNSSSSAKSFGAAQFALVLTSSDQKSIEQNEASIVEQIFANQGKSFEIMEDGVEFEIIPVLEKGKVVIERNGKPKFIKVAKNKSASRVIASPGDLKREQEKEVKVRLERAQYMQLKKISSELVKPQSKK